MPPPRSRTSAARAVGAGQWLAVLAEPHEAVLGQAPALVAGLAPQPDVVLLRAREVDQVACPPARGASPSGRPAGRGRRAGPPPCARPGRCTASTDGKLDERLDRPAPDHPSRRGGRGRRSSPAGAGTNPRARSARRRGLDQRPTSSSTSAFARLRSIRRRCLELARCPRGSSARSAPRGREAS